MRGFTIALLLAAGPASAACWTTTAPTKFCALPASGNPASYEWAKADDTIIAQTSTPTVSIGFSPATSPIAVKVRGVAANGTRGPWSPLSDDVYIRPGCGDDIDDSGTVNANDWLKLIATFTRGCKSLASVPNPTPATATPGACQ